MDKLSDRLLMEAYFKALELELAKDFITIIKKEMERRRLFRTIQYS
ncbi:MAG TPA: sporulation histidine kinase inhibitor Sda [Bacillales bacterium]|nr:sporulation histidine kinase inhibitor Sda [Bacillales bacterium]